MFQWSVSDYPETTFSPDDKTFWTDVIEYAENQIKSAEVITFGDVTYDEPINIVDTKSSAGADLITAMEEIHGSEYSKRLLSSNTSYGIPMKLYADLEYSVMTSGYKTWTTTISVTSLIVGVLRLTATSALISAICGVMGVAISATTFIPAGTINKYVCVANLYRYVTINSSTYMYAMADKYYKYMGYEDANLNSTGRADIDVDSQTIIYGVSSTYFNSFSSIFADAYDQYLLVGQQP